MSKSKLNNDIRDHVPSVSQEHFSSLLGKNPLPVFILDVETGDPEEYTFLTANEAACDQYGYSEDEFGKMKLLDLHPEEDIKEVLEDVAPSRGLKYGEYSSTRPGRHVIKDGSVIYVDITSNRIIYEGRQAKVAIARNITERIQAKKSLQESEERYRMLVERNHAGVTLVQDGKLNFVSERVAEILGYDVNEIEGKSPLDFLHVEDVAVMEENMRRRQAGLDVPDIYPVRAVRKGGELRMLEIIGSLVTWNGKPALLGSVVDVTEQRKAEETLRESEENLRRMLDAVEDLVYVCTSDHTIDFVNKAFAEELQKEAVGKSCYEAVFDRDKPCVGCNLGGVIDGETERYEIANNKSERMYDVIHTPFSKADGTLCAIHFMRDITERKKMEEKLKYNYALLETQQEVSPDGILVVDENMEMVSFNQRFVDMWKLPSKIVDTSSDEIAINSVLDKLIDPEEFVSRVNYLYEHPELKSREEVLLKDGRVFDRHSSPMFSSDGEYLGRIWFFRDITERKQAEEALKEVKEDLERKNEEMEAFVYTAAHDLRTPLISVRGFLDLMKKQLEGRLDEKSKFYMERVMKNAEHFDNLLGDLLEFSQVGVDTGQRDEINLSALAREVAYETARSYDIEASLAISEKLPIVNMQSSRVYQLLKNLIDNSVRFKRSEIPLELEIGVVPEEDDIPAGHVSVYVRDNGIGIEEDIHGEIFGLFSRPAANSEEGTGVGLAIVKRIVEEEGGSIRVESTPGEGTTFYFSLPVVGTSF